MMAIIVFLVFIFLYSNQDRNRLFSNSIREKCSCVYIPQQWHIWGGGGFNTPPEPKKIHKKLQYLWFYKPMIWWFSPLLIIKWMWSTFAFIKGFAIQVTIFLRQVLRQIESNFDILLLNIFYMLGQSPLFFSVAILGLFF